MIGINDIAFYIPEKRLSNYAVKDKFDISDDFIEEKLGVTHVSRMTNMQDTSDLCCEAFNRLGNINKFIEKEKLDVIVVCTQNPDYKLPHTSAIVHGKLDLPETCAAFDISLGCSGYVYGLAIIDSLMKSANMNHGCLFTADPYSKIIDADDKNTSLLFGDAATVTYLNHEPVMTCGNFSFGTSGKDFEHLICRNNTLSMNGREIFNFAARKVPNDVDKLLKLNNLCIEDIDKFLFHQGSKYITDFLIKRIGLSNEKVPYVIQEYGNTVSSSIPIMLKNYLSDNSIHKILISGFGVGLSWASGILNRKVKKGAQNK